MLRPISEWVRRQWTRLQTLQDTPHAIAGGISIGIVIGFSPLYSIKTLLALGIAWILRSSKLAAVIIVTLYDVLLPLQPLILRYQYGIGHWMLSGQWPPPLAKDHLFLHWQEWLKPAMLIEIIWPTLLGSLVLSVPVAMLVYWPLSRRSPAR